MTSNSSVHTALTETHCPQCGTLYPLDMLFAPQNGYKIQCDTCHHEFFVQSNAGSELHDEETKAFQEPVVHADDFLNDLQHEFKEVHTDAVSVPEHLNLLPNEPSLGQAQVPDIWAQINDELGDVFATPQDAERVTSHVHRVNRFQRFMSIGVTAALISLAAAMGVSYEYFPEAFDASIGDVAGVHATIAPQAVQHYWQGVQALMRDTDADLKKARTYAQQALAMDTEFSSAMALDAMATYFQIENLKWQTQRAMQQSQEAQELARMIQLLPQDLRPQEPSFQPDMLQEKAAYEHKIAQVEQALVDAEHTQLHTSLERVWPEYEQSPMLCIARALHKLQDVQKDLNMVQGLMHLCSSLTLEPTQAFDIANPPNPWLPYLEAHVAYLQGNTSKAVRYYQSALVAAPQWQRVYFDLALMYYEEGSLETSKFYVDHILKNVPEHERAQELLSWMQKVE